jgi:hypothetical protein
MFSGSLHFSTVSQMFICCRYRAILDAAHHEYVYVNMALQTGAKTKLFKIPYICFLFSTAKKM